MTTAYVCVHLVHWDEIIVMMYYCEDMTTGLGACCDNIIHIMMIIVYKIEPFSDMIISKMIIQNIFLKNTRGYGGI